jgi:hypothetical protein
MGRLSPLLIAVDNLPVIFRERPTSEYAFQNFRANEMPVFHLAMQGVNVMIFVNIFF